ncbi:quinone oxidoreductase family protein [Henriciella aquimarina]|uniref:quinone oxidoreductase family protein n=1 Tax=Henriciella aquimarina TaxID=545261 RepID=UPI000A027528|nr:zinc-binding dehydrogenase [Henriciella aquimarina]
MTIAAHGGPEALKMTEVATPEPAEGEVTIDVEFAGVSFIDIFLRRGDVTILPLPMTPGVEAGGTIRAVGKGVTGFSPGDRVVAFLNNFVLTKGLGGYAEVAVARHEVILKLDNGTDMAAATAALANGTTAMMALKDAGQVTPDDVMFLPGASGGVASMAIQIAKNIGVSRIIGVASTAEKRAAALKQGCTDVLEPDGLEEALSALTEKQGIDLALDAVGGPMRAIALRQLAPFGRMVLLGNASGKDEPLSGDEIWHGAKTVRGFSLGKISQAPADLGRVASAAQSVVDLVSRGALEQPVTVLPLEEAGEAHRRLEAREVSGKVLLKIEK